MNKKIIAIAVLCAISSTASYAAPKRVQPPAPRAPAPSNNNGATNSNDGGKTNSEQKSGNRNYATKGQITAAINANPEAAADIIIAAIGEGVAPQDVADAALAAGVSIEIVTGALMNAGVDLATVTVSTPLNNIAQKGSNNAGGGDGNGVQSSSAGLAVTGGDNPAILNNKGQAPSPSKP